MDARCGGDGERAAPVDGPGSGGYVRDAFHSPDDIVLEKIFTWWSGATVGTLFTLSKSAEKVGEDEFGNTYWQARTDKGSYDPGRRRRYVTYKGYADPTSIPPDWHAWIHYLVEEPPTVAPLKRRAWEKPHLPNLTGTVYAWTPKGSIARGGERAPAVGDYQAWSPGEDA